MHNIQKPHLMDSSLNNLTTKRHNVLRGYFLLFICLSEVSLSVKEEFKSEKGKIYKTNNLK